MRSLSEMTAIVQELVHDRTSKTYSTTLVAARLRDAYRDLCDRLLDDPLGQACLLAIGDETTVAASIDLPAACARLLRVELYNETEEEWFPLPNRQQNPSPVVPPVYRNATFQSLSSTYAECDPLNWRRSQDSASILLYPATSSGTIRMVYLAIPAYPTGAAGVLALPEGADELVELLAADKLCIGEPQDQRRIQTYASMFAARYSTWVRGAAAGRIDRTQKYVAEVGE